MWPLKRIRRKNKCFKTLNLSERIVCTAHALHRHENSWRHASRTNWKKMRNHTNEDHKFASFLIITYIYDAIFASFSGMTSILRLLKSWNNLNFCNKLTNHPILYFWRLYDQIYIKVIEKLIKIGKLFHSLLARYKTPRRCCRRVPIFCMGSWVTKIFGDPP